MSEIERALAELELVLQRKLDHTPSDKLELPLMPGLPSSLIRLINTWWDTLEDDEKIHYLHLGVEILEEDR